MVPARVAVLLATLAVLAPVSPAAAAPRYADFTGCAGPESHEVVVGAPACRTLRSAALGTTTAYGYVVPPVCAQRRCPVLYLLHGGGGDFRTFLGTAAQPDPFVTALLAAPSLPVVLVTPQARTLPGGFGPFAGADGGWVDWNPRYAQGGDAERYATPAPRFATHLADEVVPAVERVLPVLRGRRERAIAGCSLGGFGALHAALTHPDRYAAVGSWSLVGDPRLSTARVARRPPDGPLAPRRPDTTPVTPALTGPAAEPAAGTGAPFSGYVAAAAYAFGDPLADAAAFEGNAPAALATNLRGSGMTLRRTVLDAVPRAATDNPGGVAGELVAISQAAPLSAALRQAGVPFGFRRLHGLHCRLEPYARELLEAVTAPLGRRMAWPATVDFRTLHPRDGAWGWAVRHDGRNVLSLWDAGCRRFTVSGRGDVRIVPPPRCRARPVDLALGAGATRTVALSRRRAAP